MPRPGPRPYECVRRAWHSDRHQPIRGSLIQEIFRVVNEVHGSATRKNREWQEKLPIVVLKAEEIMYSKANSEAEYSDPKTLWDRLNDAINTIIRRDESTETGELLQPCIEAALHLGCTPRRSSRSQRNDSPRHYLRAEPAETTSVPHTSSNTNVYRNPTINSPLFMPHCQFDSMKNPLHSSSKVDNHSIHGRPDYIKNLPQWVQPHASSNATWSVYPLYSGNQISPGNPKLHSSSKPLDDKLSLQQDFVFPANHQHNANKGHGVDCDLTLRLGPASGKW